MNVDHTTSARPGASIILVTGAVGFVGAHIVRELAERGHAVIATDLPDESDILVPVLNWWQPVNHLISYFSLDVRDASAVAELRETHRPTGIVHAAAITDGRTGTLDEVNLGGTINVLGKDVAGQGTALATLQVRLLVSSASVYDESLITSTVIHEDDAVVNVPADRDQWTYAQSKRAAELWSEQQGDIRIARISSCFGPLERRTSNRTAMSAGFQAAHAVHRGETVRVESGHPSDLLYIRDTAAGLVDVLESDSVAGIVNIARVSPVTATEIGAAANAAVTKAVAGGVEPAPVSGPTLVPLVGRHKTLNTERWSAFCEPQQHGLLEAFRDYSEWLVSNDF